MNYYHMLYQNVHEARIVIEARDEEHLADIMEEGDFELEWHPVGVFSDVEFIEFGEVSDD